MKAKTNKIVLMGMVLLCATTHSLAEAFSLRRHDNVTAFYQKVSAGCIKLGLQYKVPPAAIVPVAISSE